MAVLILLDLQGMTTQIYDGINAELGFPGTVPDGLLHHVAAPSDGGMQVADVWESREHFDRFAQEMLVPAMGKVEGADAVAPPDPTELPVHNEFHS